jgi:murein DD-endopeptidase MepM/ murein hydrolase activator NlpD
MSRSGPHYPSACASFTIYSSRDGQTQKARTIRRGTAIGALLATASIIALAAGGAGLALNPHAIFGPSQTTIAAQIEARLAEGRARDAFARAQDAAFQAASAADQVARQTEALKTAEARAALLARELALAENARNVALDTLLTTKLHAEAATRDAEGARTTAQASEARAAELKTALARANAEFLDRLTGETSRAVRLGDAIAELRSSLADRDMELANTRTRLANNAATIASLTDERQARMAELAALKNRLDNAPTQPAENLRAELRIAENRLAAERSYTGEVVRWARQTRAQADLATQRAAFALTSTRQITNDSLRVLTGSAPSATDSATPAELANACGDFARVLEISRTMPIAPPFRTGLQLTGATGNGATSPRDTLIRASAAGRVTFAARAGRHDGFVIEIDHGRGITTRYSGLITIDVAQGDQIQASTPLGRVAASTRSGGDTYQIFVDGKPVNPTEALRRGAELRVAIQDADERINEAMSLFPPQKP